FDGTAWQSQANQTWLTLVNAAGNTSDDTSAAQVINGYESGTVASTYSNLFPAIFLFDTSSLPDSDVISSSTLSLYGQSKADGNSSAPNVNIYSSAPASNTGIANGDYDSLGATAFSTAITYAGWSTSGYNNFQLNASGLAAISTTSIAKFGTRDALYDVANSAPSWTSG